MCIIHEVRRLTRRFLIDEEEIYKGDRLLVKSLVETKEARLFDEKLSFDEYINKMNDLQEKIRHSNKKKVD